MAQPPLKVFVISLDRAVDRRAHMEGLLSELGLEAEFVSAVDGRALTDVDRGQYDFAPGAAGLPGGDDRLGNRLLPQPLPHL